MNTEILTWVAPAPDALPDTDTTVLLHVDNVDEPVWPGFWDGTAWFWADGQPVHGRVIEYADMPGGARRA